MTRTLRRRAAPVILWCMLMACLVGRPDLPVAHANSKANAEVTHAVIEAVDGKQEKELARLAARRDVDAWLVVDALIVGGRKDAALAYARAGRGLDFAKLPAYVRQRRPDGHDAAVRAAWAAAVRAEAAATAEAWNSAIEALLSVQNAGDAFEQAHTQLTGARALDALSREREAATGYAAGARAAWRIGWMGGAVTGWERAGFAARHAFQFDDVERYWRLLADTNAKRENWPGLVGSLTNLGSLSGELGHHDGAVALYLEAAGVLAKHPMENAETQRSKLGRLAWNTGVVRERAGRFGEAHASLEAALVHLKDDPYGSGVVSLSLAGAQRSMGRYEEALTSCSVAAAKFRELIKQGGRAAAMGEVGLARSEAASGVSLHRLARKSEARQRQLSALEVFVRRRSLPDQGRVHQNLGFQAMRDGDAKAAHLHNSKALDVSRLLKDKNLACHALQNDADTFTVEGRHAKAIEVHAQALEIAKELGSLRLMRDGHAGLARAHVGSGNPTEALRHARTAVRYLAQMLVGLATSQSASAREANGEAIRIMTEAAVALGDPKAVSDAVEEGRAASLLESLEGRERLRKAVIGPTLLKLEADARREETRALALYERAVRTRRLPEIRKRKPLLAKARTATAKIVERIQREAARGARLLYPKPATLAQIQATLRSGDVYVAYLEAGANMHALVLTPKGERIVDVGPSAELTAKLDAFQPTLEAAQGPAQLAALKTALLEKLKFGAKTKRLLVSPTGSLFRAPFSALAPKRRVVLVPSGTAYRFFVDQEAPQARGVLGLGAVDYTDRPKLSDLDGSGPEVKAIATTELLAKKATEAELRVELAKKRQWRAIHFACHGLPDDEHPMRSALALTRAAPDDGLLTASEVLQLRVRADLAVLSACETGRGRVFRGEGLLGLPRAFLFAGAPRVIVSLWKVDDAATLALMRAFYAAYAPKGGAKGVPAAEALRRAMAAVRATPKWKHPYFWSAWVIWGRGD